MRAIRLAASGAGGHTTALASHVRTLQDDGPLVFVTADRPVASWDAPFTAAGVDGSRLCVVDAVSGMSGIPEGKRPNVSYLASPTLLEMLVLRIEQGCQRSRSTQVVLDSLDALALYNGWGPVHEFAHYLIGRLRDARVGLDLVVRDGPEGDGLRARLAGLVDGTIRLEALGR